MVSIPVTKANSQATAWFDRAQELAGWTWRRLVNRTDVWGAYSSLDRRGQAYTAADGTVKKAPKNYTAPGVKQRGRVVLTQNVLARHYRARDPQDVIGLHTTSPSNTSLWGATEIDWHGEQSSDPRCNEAAAVAWYNDLVQDGFRPLLTDSNGQGGYHLRFLLAEPAPTLDVFIFLKLLINDHERHGLAHSPEIFPKQRRVSAPGVNGQFGNWLRLPGRHHSRPHWSRVWDGCRWLDGPEGVDFILAITGDPVDLLWGGEK